MALTSWLIASGQAKRPGRAAAKGAEIRARIARNRAKRLSIAEAMKLEAGVTGHEVNTENFAGLAFLGTGRIFSPEGSNMMQLYTVAHECGHIFLHDKPPGSRLATHVMEMEAESYAHQAFREHGMKLPEHFTAWGRSYVGSWIEKDRAKGIPIDPRALAYAQGTRSPFQALRRIPATWHRHVAEGNRLPWTVRLARAKLARGLLSAKARCWSAVAPVGLALAPWLHRERALITEARALLRFALRQLYVGVMLSMLALSIASHHVPLPELVDPNYHHLKWQALVPIICGALLWTDLALALRVAFGPAQRLTPTPPVPATSAPSTRSKAQAQAAAAAARALSSG